MNKWFDEDYAKQLSLEKKYGELFAYCRKCADMQTADKIVSLAMSYSTELSEKSASQLMEKSLPDAPQLPEIHNLGISAGITSDAEIKNTSMGTGTVQDIIKPEYSFDIPAFNEPVVSESAALPVQLQQNTLEKLEPSCYPDVEIYSDNGMTQLDNAATSQLMKSAMQQRTSAEPVYPSIEPNTEYNIRKKQHKKTVKRIVSVAARYDRSAAYTSESISDNKIQQQKNQHAVITEHFVANSQQEIITEVTDNIITESELKIALLQQQLNVANSKISSLEEDKRFLQQRIDDKLTSIDATVKDTNLTAHENNTMLCDISTYIRSEMPSRLAELHKAVAESGLSPDDERFDMLISELSGRILSDINKHTQQELINVKNIEATLRAWFGDVWEHLMPDTRTSLISSHMLWESSKNIGGEFDYSGIIICATAALEGELNRIFFSGFQRYMNATAGTPAIGRWPFTLLFVDKFRKLPTGAKYPKCFTMGSLPHILAPQPDRYDNHLLLNEKRAEYFAAIGTSDDAFLDSIYGAEPLLSQCEHIKTNYRNRSAHSGSINLAAAHECHQKIVSSISLIIRLHESIDWSRASAYLPQMIDPENALAVPSAT